jgi:hypothetical protein
MKALVWEIATPLVIIAVSFAASNRNTVEVGVWPLPFIWDVSVYANALGALGGAIWPWHNGTGRRKWESLLETDAT